MLEQMLVGEVGDAERLLAGQTMIRGQCHQTGLAEEGNQSQAGLVDRMPDVTDVHPPVVHDLDLVVLIGADDIDGQIRVAAASARTAAVTRIPGMTPTVNVSDPRPARRTRRCSASAFARRGRPSSSSCRPAAVNSVCLRSRTNS